MTRQQFIQTVIITPIAGFFEIKAIVKKKPELPKFAYGGPINDLYLYKWPIN